MVVITPANNIFSKVPVPSASPAGSVSSTLLQFKDSDDKKPPISKGGPLDLLKDLFLHMGYFTYDAFLLLTQSFPSLAAFAKKNKFIKQFSILIEVLCTISNTWISGSKAYQRTHSITKTAIMAVEEFVISLLLGLVLPSGIIHGVQRTFGRVMPAFKHPIGKMISGLFALVGIERAMHGSDQLAEQIVYQYEPTQKLATELDRNLEGFLAQKSSV